LFGCQDAYFVRKRFVRLDLFCCDSRKGCPALQDRSIIDTMFLFVELALLLQMNLENCFIEDSNAIQVW